MTAPVSPNSRNPANEGSLAGALAEILGKFLQGVDDMLPAVVIAYDRPTNRATVRPLVTMLTTDGIAVPRAEVASVPVFNIGGGNAVLSFNIKPGDFGWIKANDRDISLFMDAEAEAPPNTIRKHDFADSLFFPESFRSRWTLDVADEDSTVLQTIDGTQRIILHDDHLQLHSEDRILLDAPTIDILGNNITIDALMGLNIEGNDVDFNALSTFTLDGATGAINFTNTFDMMGANRIKIESTVNVAGATQLKANTGVGTVDATGNVLRTLSGMGLNVNGSAFVLGQINSFSNITALGSVAATLGGVTAGANMSADNFFSDVLSVDFNAHVHGGVTVGAGTTAIPQ